MDLLISTAEDLQREIEKIPNSDSCNIQKDMETLRDQWLEVRHGLGSKKDLQYLFINKAEKCLLRNNPRWLFSCLVMDWKHWSWNINYERFKGFGFVYFDYNKNRWLHLNWTLQKHLNHFIVIYYCSFFIIYWAAQLSVMRKKCKQVQTRYLPQSLSHLIHTSVKPIRTCFPPISR